MFQRKIWIWRHIVDLVSSQWEELLPEDDEQVTSSRPEVDQAALNELLAMGFPEVRCRKALSKTSNAGAEIALNWLLEHMEDPGRHFIILNTLFFINSIKC